MFSPSRKVRWRHPPLLAQPQRISAKAELFVKECANERIYSEISKKKKQKYNQSSQKEEKPHGNYTC